MAIEYPSFDPATGRPVYSPDNGKPAKDCPGVACDDCEGHGPITCTITTTGGCDGDAGCFDYCANDVFDLDWDGVNDWWFGDNSDGGSATWAAKVWCDGDVWYITVQGGCFDIDQPTEWASVVFVPSGCEESGADGYPTHAGIDVGNPTTDWCWDDCVPTVALS